MSCLPIASIAALALFIAAAGATVYLPIPDEDFHVNVRSRSPGNRRFQNAVRPHRARGEFHEYHHSGYYRSYQHNRPLNNNLFKQYFGHSPHGGPLRRFPSFDRHKEHVRTVSTQDNVGEEYEGPEIVINTTGNPVEIDARSNNNNNNDDNNTINNNNDDGDGSESLKEIVIENESTPYMTEIKISTTLGPLNETDGNASGLESASNVTDPSGLEPASNVTDPSGLESASNVTDPSGLEPASNVTDPSGLESASNVTDPSGLEAASNVTDPSGLELASNVTDHSGLEPASNVTDFSGLGPASNATDFSGLGSGSNVTDFSGLDPASNVTDLSGIESASNVTESASGLESGVNNGTEEALPVDTAGFLTREPTEKVVTVNTTLIPEYFTTLRAENDTSEEIGGEPDGLSYFVDTTDNPIDVDFSTFSPTQTTEPTGVDLDDLTSKDIRRLLRILLHLQAKKHYSHEVFDGDILGGH